MADMKVSELTGLDTDVLSRETDWLMISRAGAGSSFTSRKIRQPADMTAAEFGTGTETGTRLVPPAALASAARWIGGFVTGTIRRVGTFFTSGGGTYVVHTELASNVSESGARTSATRIDRPADMTNGEVTTGNSGTAKLPSPAQLKLAVDTHRPANMVNADVTTPNANVRIPTGNQLKLSVDTHAPAAIRSGTGAANGIKFNAIGQSAYDDLVFSGEGTITGDANTLYIITG